VNGYGVQEGLDEVQSAITSGGAESLTSLYHKSFQLDREDPLSSQLRYSNYLIITCNVTSYVTRWCLQLSASINVGRMVMGE
jgi:hypothetical protein